MNTDRLATPRPVVVIRGEISSGIHRGGYFFSDFAALAKSPAFTMEILDGSM